MSKSSAEAYLLTVLAREPEDNRQCFWELSDCHSDTKDGSKTARGIILTNSMSAGGDGDGGIFRTISRFNHSCSANVANVWSEKDNAQVLHAHKDIEPGEELYISYIDAYNMTHSERQSHLQRKWKFSCCCPVCALSPPEAARSDRARTRFGYLDEAI